MHRSLSRTVRLVAVIAGLSLATGGLLTVSAAAQSSSTPGVLADCADADTLTSPAVARLRPAMTATRRTVLDSDRCMVPPWS